MVSAAFAGDVEGSVVSAKPAGSAWRFSTRRSQNARAVRPLKKTARTCGCPAKNASKSLTTAVVLTIEASRLPGRSAEARTSHSAILAFSSIRVLAA